jgi:hypothetical protein
MSLSIRTKEAFHNIRLLWKIVFLIFGAVLFFLLFPLLLRYGTPVYCALALFLICTGILFRLVAGKHVFRITMILWAGGSVIYIIIAAVLIMKDVQPLPYIHFDRIHLMLYYLSYPLRVLGIFFIGLIFAGVTSPAEFLHWGEFGLRIALLYRAFEFSVLSINDIRKALILQGDWPERSGGFSTSRNIGMFIKGTPLLVATIFRNIIIWFPWAWICYTELKEEIRGRKSG